MRHGWFHGFAWRLNSGLGAFSVFFFFWFRSESDLSFPYQFLFLLISLGRDVIFPVLGDFPFFFFLFFQCMYVCVGPSDVNDV